MPVAKKGKTPEPVAPVDFVIITALEEVREAVLSEPGSYQVLGISCSP